MGLRSLIRDSCNGGDKVSSKRIIMYIFTFALLFMILIEAAFNLMIIWKCSSTEALGCEFQMVFDAVIYGYGFGIVAAIAGINGFSKTEIPPVKNNG